MAGTFTRSERFAVGQEPYALNIDNPLGNVDITVVPGLDEIRWELKGEQRVIDGVEVSFDGDTFRVLTEHHRFSILGRLVRTISSDDGVDVRLELPEKMRNAVLKLDMGNLRIRGGAFGPASITTGKGNVEIEDFTCSENLEFDSNLVSPRGVAGSIKTGMGNISVGIAAGVTLEAGAGNIEVDHLIDGGKVEVGTGNVVVEKLSFGKLDASSGLGNIDVGVPYGTPALLDCSSGLGKVRSELQGGGEPEPGAPYVEVHGETGMGNVSIRYA